MAQLPYPSWQVELHTPLAQLLEATWAALQARPQAPQLATSAEVLTSQPSAGRRSQSPNPALQLAIAHLLALHAAVAFCRVHTAPHAPQLFASVVVFTSQPSAANPSQLANPTLQDAIPQIPAEQLAVAFGRLHTKLQEPQFDTSVSRLTHEPLQLVKPVPHPVVHAPLLQTWPLLHAVVQLPQWAESASRFASQPVDASPSQSAYPVLQLAIVHCPETQASVAFARLQTAPQLPQLFTFVFRFTSQPSTGLPLQSAYPGLQLLIVHTPALQVETAFGSEHWLPQAPQLPALVVRFTSQPSDATVLQSPNPLLQLAMAQAPATQAAVALGRLQAREQPPQLETSVRVLTSQPLDASPSQSAHPVEQAATAHCPEVQVEVALGSTQAAPHAPQLVTEVCRSTSQPSAATALQLAYPASQAATVHAPLTQASVAWARLHTTPQAPQFAGSEDRLTQEPLQLVSPVPQVWVQTPLLQTCPEVQAIPHVPQCAPSVPRFTSHPLLASPSQSANPAEQLATVQAPALQAAVAFARLHTLPHPPQLAGSELTLTSHPSVASPSQSAQPASHDAIEHVLELHEAVAWAGAQMFAHAPQLRTSDEMLTSQPSTAWPLQSAYPGWQLAITHRPAWQDGVAFSSEQGLAQVPQLFPSVARLISQPSTATPLQSAKPGVHVPTVHVPALHSGVAFGARHAWLHAPQLVMLDAMFTSQPSAAAPLQSA